MGPWGAVCPGQEQSPVAPRGSLQAGEPSPEVWSRQSGQPCPTPVLRAELGSGETQALCLRDRKLEHARSGPRKEPLSVVTLWPGAVGPQHGAARWADPLQSLSSLGLAAHGMRRRVDSPCGFSGPGDPGRFPRRPPKHRLTRGVHGGRPPRSRGLFLAHSGRGLSAVVGLHAASQVCAR